MKIKCLRNLGPGLPALTEGQVTDVDEATGKELCKRGLAEDLTPPAPRVRSKSVVQPPPEPEAELPVEIKAVPEPLPDMSAEAPEIGKAASKIKPAKAEK